MQDLCARSDNHAEAEAEAEAEADAHVALERRVTELEGGVNARLEELGMVVEGARWENRRLGGLVDGVRGEWERELEGAVGVVRGDMRDIVRAEVCRVVEEVVGKAMEGLQCGGSCGRGADTNMGDVSNKDMDIVPDSMPRERQVVSSGQDHDTSLQTLSQSTLGSSSFSDAGDQPVHARDHLQKTEPDPDEAEYSMIKQDGRGLSEYFSLTEAGRGQLPPRKREGRIVEAFVAGLDDVDVRGRLEKRLDEEGWMWGVVTTVVQGIVREREASRQTDRPKYKSKKRRCIPIVPVDEEDLLYN